MAVQLGSGVKPLTVKTAGEVSVASVGLEVTMVPLVQTRVTLTLAPLSGTKSLLTEKVSTFRVLVIVHWPTATRGALQVPVEP